LAAVQGVDVLMPGLLSVPSSAARNSPGAAPDPGRLSYERAMVGHDGFSLPPVRDIQKVGNRHIIYSEQLTI